MGVADVNSFVQPCCVCLRRDELFDEPQGGVSGTVHKQMFIDWIKLKILPFLIFLKRGNLAVLSFKIMLQFIWIRKL
jgi:hypothetical protein